MAIAGDGPVVHPGYGWLPAVVPETARTFAVGDSDLAEILLGAGAELDAETPDVEIASPGALRGVAGLAVVVAGGPRPLAGSRLLRSARRLARFVSARVGARRARRLLERLDYRDVSILQWDLRQPIRTSAQGGPNGRRALVERLPQGVLVVGRRADRSPTMLEAALAQAASSTGLQLDSARLSVRVGLVLATDDQSVLRIAVGAAERQIRDQAAAVATLDAARPSETVHSRVPWVVARGKSGLAEWSLEQRLPGERPQGAIAGALLGDCLEFLVALNGLRASSVDGDSFQAQADTVTSALGSGDASRVRKLAADLDRDLASVPRGFGHGDFFQGNLLVEGEKLTGVVDWEAAGPARLPLLDLLHLTHSGDGNRNDLEWGPSLVDELLPWAERGGDETSAEYCERLGLDMRPETLRRFVIAYWLDRAAFQLRTYPRRSQSAWLRLNIDHVVAAVT